MKKKSFSVEKDELNSFAQYITSNNCVDSAHSRLIELATASRPRAGLAFHFVNCIATYGLPRQGPQIFHLFDEFLPPPHRPEALEHTLATLANFCVRIGWAPGYFRCFFRARQLRRAGLVSKRFTIMPVSYKYLREHGYCTWSARL